MTEKTTLAVYRGGDRRVDDAMREAYQRLPWIIRVLGRWRLRLRRKLGIEPAYVPQPLTLTPPSAQPAQLITESDASPSSGVVQL